MDAYLYRLAQKLFAEWGDDISTRTFVFPNRRAGLFFQKYLGQIAHRPLMAPDIWTLGQCFEQIADIQLADKVALLFKLYPIYTRLSHSDEPFDDFAFWGEMLLNDFNEVDSCLVPAKQLFTNLQDIKRLDDTFNYLSDAQRTVITEFWSHLSSQKLHATEERFVQIWNVLWPVYEELTKQMTAEKCGYEGFVQRQALAKIERTDMTDIVRGRQFVFVGFNALTPCEHKLFTLLRKANCADFYWDYEAEELRAPDNRASQFFKSNTTEFPSHFQLEPLCESMAEKMANGQIHLYGVPSGVGQAKKIYDILNEIYPVEQQTSTADYTQTAIVLPNEALLLPLLHSLPEQIEKINVTMGYPLASTPVVGLMEHIFGLQQNMRLLSNGQAAFYHKNVLGILNHQYVFAIQPDECRSLADEIVRQNKIYISADELGTTPLLSVIFAPQMQVADALTYLRELLRALQANLPQTSNAVLDKEYIYHYYTLINRMADIFAENASVIQMKPETLFRLLRQLAVGISIPFVGEPLNGLQVMGVLETRGLDFKNLIIASMNEGIFPKKAGGNTFIPYNLRRGFGLPTYEQQDAVFAYNFYRMVHHAQNIHFIYDTRTEVGGQSGEMSRYLYQLRYQYNLPLEVHEPRFSASLEAAQSIEVKKTPDVLQKLSMFAQPENGRALSASALNTYLDCPMRFYLTYVERLREPDQVTENMEANVFGSIFHETMESLYAPLCGRMVSPSALREMAKNTLLIEREIARAFTHVHLHVDDKHVPDDKIRYPTGRNKLISNILKKYVQSQLEQDAQYAPFTYVASEMKCKGTINLSGGVQINLTGFIDRVDQKENVVRIVDYKTGKSELSFKVLADLFDSTKSKRPKYILQTFLYAMLYRQQTHVDGLLEPNIFSLRTLYKAGTSTRLDCDKKPITDYQEYAEEYEQLLANLLEEIMQPELTFTQCADAAVCEEHKCPFRNLCRR